MARTGRLEPPLASAILSAKDIHNHLVPLALSRGTRVVATRVTPLLRYRSTRGCLSLLSLSEERGGARPEKDLPMSSLLPSFLPSFSSRLVSNSLDFLLLLPVPFDARGELPEFRASIQSEHTRGEETKFRLYTSRSGREREIKDGDLASFRASLLFGPVLFCRSALSVLTGTSRRRKQNRREERNRGPKFSVVRAVLCREFTETRGGG